MFTTEYLLYLVIIATGFVIGLARFHQLQNMKWVVIILGITLICESLTRVLAYEIKNSNPPYHFLAPILSLLWGAFFYFEFQSVKAKRISVMVGIALLVLSIINSLFFQSLYTFPDTFLKVQSLVFISLGFGLVIEKVDAGKQNIFSDPGFLSAIAVVWFNLVSFLFFNFYRFFVNKVASGQTLRLINYVSNYIFYLILLIAVIKAISRKKYQLSVINEP